MNSMNSVCSMNVFSMQERSKFKFFGAVILCCSLIYANATAAAAAEDAMSPKDRLNALVKRANAEQGAPSEIPPAYAKAAEASNTKSAGNALEELVKSHGSKKGKDEAQNQKILVPATGAPAEIINYEVPPPRPPTLRDQAFQELLNKISPLTPEQIIEMRRAQDRTQRAVATAPDVPPRPVSSTLVIDLSPGMTPPIVRLGSGYVSSLVFLDSTGQPWPIADYSLGDPKNFNLQWDRKTNTIFMQSNTTYASGNLAVRLANLDTPVMLSLVSGQKEMDYRVDLQVRGRGPNAKAAVVGDALPAGPDPLLLSVLDGVPPAGSIELQVTCGCGLAWLYKDKMIFRTHLTILSPAWVSTVSSADGTRVYEMAPTPLVIATQNGKMVKIAIRGL